VFFVHLRHYTDAQPFPSTRKIQKNLQKKYILPNLKLSGLNIAWRFLLVTLLECRGNENDLKIASHHPQLCLY
jgi:hypothetical protein